MPEMADYESALEAIWRDLRQHLEWADGFLLVLLYTLHPAPARELLRRAESQLQTRGLEPLLLRPRDADQAHTIVQTVIAARPEPGGERPAIWLDLWERSSDKDWQAQRYEILARLNERRFLLEQKVGRPLVLILPEEDRSQMHVLAPDLWTVRAYSMGLPVPPAEGRRGEITLESGQHPAAVENTLAPVELEWRRLLAAVPEQERAERLDPRDGVAASLAALERGALTEAAAHAEVALSIARARQLSGDSNRWRDLYLALEVQGATRRAAGDLQAARASYQESLEVSRQLCVVLGNMPQAQRYLSIALEHVGEVAHDLGDLEAARAAYSESLEISQQLRAALGDTPQVLRDQSIALEHVGRVARELGDLETARVAYAKSLGINQQLRAALGDTPGLLRELAIGLGNYGLLQNALQDPATARTDFQEGADLAARLVALQPEHPGYRKLQDQFQTELDKLEHPE
ncbi:MAG: tetratricopeptide repeat protein [Gammaproteobacteria bacterium]|nr:tetratricopeptide repeat protein [Gammaproteobacteria bacterium]